MMTFYDGPFASLVKQKYEYGYNQKQPNTVVGVVWCGFVWCRGDVGRRCSFYGPTVELVGGNCSG